MPLKINGHTVPWSLVLAGFAATSWLSILQWQGVANADDLEKLEDLPTQIAEMRVESRYMQASVDAIAKALGVEVVAATAVPVVVEEDEDSG